MDTDWKFIMRQWASTNGAVVRQRSVRQETTMAKAGTLPEPAYNLDLVPINQSFIQIENTSPVEKRHEDEDDNEDEMIEYESDSEDDEIDNTSDGNMQFSEVSRHSTFLIGGRSRFGRNIRLNNRYIH